MAVRKITKRWSYCTGEKGRNRIRVYERNSGTLMLEYRDNGQRKRLALGHKDRDKAIQQAHEAAGRLATAGEVEDNRGSPAMLDTLFDIYLDEVTPTKALTTQKHDRRALKMFRRYYTGGREVLTLSRRDHERFIRDRRAGRIGPSSNKTRTGVRDRAIEQDLRLLNAVFNWATMAGDGRGNVLLDRNPFKGYRIPREKNPRQVRISQDAYGALLDVSKNIDWRFHVALVLAHETGHRIGAISSLRWSDVDLTEDRVTWRAENEKTGYAHVTPLTAEARRAIIFARQNGAGIGEAPVLPAPRNAATGVSRHLMRDWWKKAERLAGLPPERGRGWHSLRRKFATDLMRAPLKVLAQLGGWKSPQTIINRYQHAEQGEMSKVLESRRNGTDGV